MQTMNASESKNVVWPVARRRKPAEYVVHRMAALGLFDYTVLVLNSGQVSSSGWCAADQGKPADLFLQTPFLLFPSGADYFGAAQSAAGILPAIPVGQSSPTGRRQHADSRSFSLSPIRRMRGQGRGCLLFTSLSPILLVPPTERKKSRIVSVKPFSILRFRPAIRNNSATQISQAL